MCWFMNKYYLFLSEQSEERFEKVVIVSRLQSGILTRKPVKKLEVFASNRSTYSKFHSFIMKVKRLNFFEKKHGFSNSVPKFKLFP